MTKVLKCPKCGDEMPSVEHVQIGAYVYTSTSLTDGEVEYDYATQEIEGPDKDFYRCYECQHEEGDIEAFIVDSEDQTDDASEDK